MHACTSIISINSEEASAHGSYGPGWEGAPSLQ